MLIGQVGDGKQWLPGLLPPRGLAQKSRVLILGGGVLACSKAPPKQVDRSNNDDQQRQRRAGVAKVVGDQPEVRHITCKIVNAENPASYPDGSAEGVEEQKLAPIHSERAGDHPIELSQPGDEPSDGNGERAVALKLVFELTETFGVDADMSAVFDDQRATEGMPNNVTNIVADHCGEPGEQNEPLQLNAAVRGQNGGEDQNGLAGQRQSERLEPEDDDDRSNAVLAQIWLDDVEQDSSVFHGKPPSHRRTGGEPEREAIKYSEKFARGEFVPMS